MRTDTFVQAADWHRRQGVPCQDSGFATLRDGGACLGVADGCSSGAGSEYGSQAVIRSLAQLRPEQPLTLLDTLLPHWQALGGVEDSAMLATAVRCVIAADTYGDLQVGFQTLGDGIGGVLRRDGSLWCWSVDWNNMPPYPWYRTNAMQQQWEKEATPGTLTLWEGGEIISVETLDPASPYVWLGDGDNWQAAWVGSDGWLTLGETMPDIAREVTAYKNTEGAFLKRRLGRWLAGLEKQGRIASDDLGMAAIVRG